MKRIPLLLVLIAILPVFSSAYGAEDLPPLEIDTPIANTGADLIKTLEDHRWTLALATDSEGHRIDALFPATGHLFTITFSASRLSFQGGCNSFAGAYQINAQGLLEAERMAATLMACEPALMQADAALVALLAQPLRIEVAQGLQPMLQLLTPSNETLGLEGQVTPEALYGAGAIMFLEIDARQLACRNPRNGQTTCLQARAVQFDEQGLRVPPPGPWQPFYETIEGYNHTPGVRNVVRVKRFDRGAVPGDTTSAIYVLDLIVESETMPPWQSGS